MNKYFARVPGYFIEADIDFPDYHPHTIWWLAYISEILKGKTISELEENPPWPIPNDKIITKHLIRELIEQEWIILDWKNSKLQVSSAITEIYRKGGEIALAQKYLKYSTERGQWWIDALSGTPLSVSRANQYDYDFNRPTTNSTQVLKSQLSERDLIENLNFDIKTLLRLFKLEDIDDPFKYNRAFLSSPITISGKKDIEFEMYVSFKGDHQRILPQDLAALEPMLWENAPEIFGKRSKRTKRLFLWNRSSIETFASILERFPNYVSFISTSQFYKYLTQRLDELIERKEEWINWYILGIDVLPLADVSELFFDALTEICDGSLKINGDTPEKPPNKIIIYTSFLNLNHLYKMVGLINSLKSTTQEAQILIIYGHASDDTPEQQKTDMKEYANKIVQFAPLLKGRVKIISSVKRSHEKLILSTCGDWLIGSWNAGSSNPDSQLFEVGVMGRSRSFSLKLLQIVEESVERENNIQFLKSFMEELNTIPDQNAKDKARAELFYSILKEKTTELITLLSEQNTYNNIQELYNKALNSSRLCLLPFLKRAKVRTINEHQSRDVLITQIRSTEQEIFLASDRITKTALDRTLLNDIIGRSGESKKFVRILWGREWENNKKLSKKIRKQLRDGRNTIRMAQSFLGAYLLTNNEPMENHGKFALFDGKRGLITSENILSYGGEKGIHESRELGLFIECIPVIRHIQGWSSFHRLNHLHPDRTISEMAYRPYEWIVLGSDIYYAFDIIKNTLNFDYSNTIYIQEAIEDYLRNPDSSEFDEFDRSLIQERYDCYLERSGLIQDPYIEFLKKEGIRFYLLKPVLDNKWLPFAEPIKESEILSLKSTKKKKVPRERIAQEQDEIRISDISIIETHHIVKRIMDDMVLIKKGEFMMGDPEIYEDRPVHQVELTHGFYMGKYMVTQKLWKEVMGYLPPITPNQRSPNFPVISVNYYDAQKFFDKLNSLPGSGGFDLPTDAQWEYACRAGSSGKYCFGNDHNLLNQYAWHQKNSDRKIHDVGLLKPNKWGLFDMHGLMFELMKDDIRKYSKNKLVDPIGPLDTNMDSARGGAWGLFPFPKNTKRLFFRCGRRSPNAKTEKSYRLSFRLIRKI